MPAKAGSRIPTLYIVVGILFYAYKTKVSCGRNFIFLGTKLLFLPQETIPFPAGYPAWAGFRFIQPRYPKP